MSGNMFKARKNVAEARKIDPSSGRAWFLEGESWFQAGEASDRSRAGKASDRANAQKGVSGGVEAESPGIGCLIIVWVR